MEHRARTHALIWKVMIIEQRALAVLPADLAALLWLTGLGDHEAFKTLYDTQSSRLYAVAMRVTRQPGLAADALHEAFLQVWRYASRFDSTRGTPESWLLSIVRYRALDIARRRSREVSLNGASESVDPDPDALSQILYQEDASALHHCLAKLRSDRRRLVTLAFVDGLSHSELAEHLAMPIGSVKSLIRRSLMTLHECLHGTCDGPARARRNSATIS